MLRTPPQNMITKDDVRNDGEEQRNMNRTPAISFQNSRKVIRSPVLVDLSDTQARTPGVTRSKETTNRNKRTGLSLDLDVGQYDMETPTTVNPRVIDPAEQITSTYSPRLEQIKRMRGIEEESLQKCVAVLRKMVKALERQKNISKDVKDGVGELNEQMDVIESCRRIWKELESTRNKEAEKTARDSVQVEKFSLQSDEKETPVTGGAKRVASSPAAPLSHKKVKENGQGEWQMATHRKNRQKPQKENKTPATDEGNRKRERKKRRKKTSKETKKLPEAVLIKSTEGKSYSDVLKDLKKSVRPEDAQVAIKAVRKTKNGCVLLELAEGGSKQKFCDAIKSSLKETVNVSALKPKTTIEIRDLDSLTEADEVAAAIKELIREPEEEFHTHVTRSNTREQRRAFVTLSTEAALTVINSQRIKIGWTSCRVKIVPNVPRCFKCFGSGHTQWKCKGPDRKSEGLCIRCGKVGHKMRDCTDLPQCCICIAEGRGTVDHIPGTARCPTYKGTDQL